VVGCLPAIVLGLAIGLYRPVPAAFDPLISATYPIRKTSLLPLILPIFGLGESSKIAMVAIGVFYPVVINTAVRGAADSADLPRCRPQFRRLAKRLKAGCRGGRPGSAVRVDRAGGTIHLCITSK
jgi:ABC-type nitrate/sulfonate/bicarbonate transport system permease component